MPYVLVLQRTVDYAQWKRVFDSAAPMRAEAGCVDTMLLRDRTDPQQMVVLFEFESLDRAERYIADPHLQEAWRQAGVAGETEIHMLTRAERDARPDS